MLRKFKAVYSTICGDIQRTLPEQGVLVEANYLTEKRAKAIEYLGDKWPGSKSKFIQLKETT